MLVNVLVLLPAVVILYLVIQPIASYIVDKNDLRRFPSPSFAGLTSLWRIHHNLRNRHFRAIHHAHEQFGTHVRIAPKHISISDPRAMAEIYGHGANMLKDPFYDGGAGPHRNLADTRVKSEHQRKRRMLAHIFAQKTIVALEPMVADTVSCLVRQVDAHARDDKAMDLRRYLNFFTIDFFSKLVYGESLGCVSRGDDIVSAQRKDGTVYKVPFISSLHNSMIINTILSMEAPLLPFTRKMFTWHPYSKSGVDYDNIIRYNTLKRLEKPDDGNDIFSKFLGAMSGPQGMPLDEVHAECSVLMNGGTDTTSSALTNTIYLLSKHPTVLAKLRNELDSAMGDAEIPTYGAVSQLPYLRACIDESLRLRPASSMGLPRTVPKGGRVIAGQFIEEDVTVSVPTYTLLRNTEAFEEPERYNPDRWMQGDKDKMAKAHLPFSTGPRACIGRNISYFEQTLVIAALVHRFDLEFVEESFELEIIERFNSNPGSMIVKCRRRS
jgi:cytochrome P450